MANDRGRPGEKAAPRSNGDTLSIPMTAREPAADLTAYIEHFRARVLQDALAEATAMYWLRRADTFAAVGNPRCDEIAIACRRHATLIPLNDDELVAAANEEVA